jgi:hypothetical protein
VTIYEQTLETLQQRYPSLKVVPIEDSKLIDVLDFIAWWADLDDDYTTTICNTVYMAKSKIGTIAGADVLWHEAEHVGQWKRWNVIYYLSYFLLLPLVFTVRAYWEWQAYRIDLLREKQLTRTISQRTEDKIVRVFCGVGYLWMFPFPGLLRRWVRSIREGR